MPRVDIIFPVLPPVIDGIGDHTARLATATSGSWDVRILTAQENWAPVEGVEVVRAFTMDRRSGVLEILEAVRQGRPDWVVVQFNQYSYGRWGVNPFLPIVVRRLRRLAPRPKIALLAHEDFIPIRNARSLVFGAIQRAQFYSLGRSSDLFLTTIQPWADRYGEWFPKAERGVIPAGANIPEATSTRANSRTRYQLSDDTIVLGFFGSARVDRRLDAVAELAQAIHASGRSVRVLYVGNDAERVVEHLGRDIVIDAGVLPALEAANALIASDVFVAPYLDGVSGRRGGFLAGLRLGIPALSNVGGQTDQELRDANGEAFLLADDETNSGFVSAGLRLISDVGLREQMGGRGAAFYRDRYSWPAIAEMLLTKLT